MQQDVTVKIGEELMGLHKTGNVDILYGQSMDTVIYHTNTYVKQAKLPWKDEKRFILMYEKLKYFKPHPFNF